MSFEGDYWGHKGAIEIAAARFDRSRKTPSDHVRLASVYYSAATRAFAEIKSGRVWYVIRLLWCSNRAMDLATTAGRANNFKSLSLDDIDVVSAIWSRFGNPILMSLREKRHDILQHAHARVTAGEECNPHTRAFLMIHAHKLSGRKIDEHVVFKLEMLASATALQADFAQAARVNRAIANLLHRSDKNRARLYAEAEALARKASASDQLIKMGVRS
ncbi:MAG: hypothetical protein V4606_04750 [Patescibacteria group bacterium]